jgi:hypothetical protein
MPRQCRYFIPNIPQHVITRGADRQAVFFHEQDYSLYLELAVDPSAKQQAYRALFHNVLDEKLLARIRRSTNACGVIGEHRFKEQIEAMLGRAVPTGKRGRPRLGN